MTKKIYTVLIIALIFFNKSHAQNPPLVLVSPNAETNKVSTAKQFISGRTCKECAVSINGAPVKVYKTGVFAFPVNLNIGTNSIVLIVAKEKKFTQKTITYIYETAKPIKETDSFIIEKITMEPNGDMALQEGEYILIKVKAKPNCKVVMNDKYTLTELPKNQTKGIAGNYQIHYKVMESDNLLLSKFKFDLISNGKKRDTKIDNNTITLFKDDEPMIGTTTMQNTIMYSGLGEDRLGGTKAGFLDSMVHVQIVGRIQNMYKVKLNKQLTVYIPKSTVEILPNGNTIPKSLTNNISANGDSLYDYVRIGLNGKLPYLSNQNAKTNQLTVDVYGATVNSNWVMQFPETLQEIDDVNVDQVQDDMTRVTINLKSKQLWGYKMYYEGNVLVVKVRRQKENLSLQNMVIGVDAGHGGSNDGALGIAGKYEKEFTLIMAKELRDMLESKGAKVIMTRESDISFENLVRLNMYRKKMPDFALSIHLNSAGDPLRVKGVSTYYKYSSFKNLSGQIYKRVKETGLHPWGHIGNFNFFLNSATEFPTALVECLFISNPEDEEKIHDLAFRTSFNQKIVQGIEDWLQQCAQNK
jgi:N-acetylmuramoyl-L-alanine amidase